MKTTKYHKVQQARAGCLFNAAAALCLAASSPPGTRHSKPHGLECLLYPERIMRSKLKFTAYFIVELLKHVEIIDETSLPYCFMLL